MSTNHTHKDSWGTGLLSWLLIALVFTICGCGQPQGELFPELESSLEWPRPPETPRIKYVGQLSTQDDLHRAVSALESLQQAIFGRQEIGVLVGPYALALDESGRLFVSDTGGAVVHMMDLNTRDYFQFSTISESEKLITPVGLCIAEQLIYVADSSLGKICVFDPEGKFKFFVGEGLLERPSGIAYHTGEQKLLVADAAQHTIFIFSPQGQDLGKIGTRGIGQGQFNFPTHLWIDKMGNLYVSDTLNYRIQIFSPQGEFIRKFGQQGDRPGYFAHPCGLATDNLGNIYVIDKQFEYVQIFNQEGDILLAFGGEGNKPGQFWLPAGIFIDNDNRIFIADQFNKRIQVFQLLERSKP